MNLTPQAEEQINYVCPYCDIHRNKKENTCNNCNIEIQEWGLEIKESLTIWQRLAWLLGIW